MTAMDTRAVLTVGQVAERFGVTVRTLLARVRNNAIVIAYSPPD